MADHLTEARPYAKAIFAIALEHQKLTEWADALNMLSQFTLELQKYYILKNPKFRKQQKIDLFLDPAHKIAEYINFPEAKNLLRFLMLQKHLLILPEINKIYQEMINTHSNILKTTIKTAIALDGSQKKKIIGKLALRYKKEIHLAEIVDPKLIGGAIIYAGDQVLDSSITGSLKRLKETLLK